MHLNCNSALCTGHGTCLCVGSRTIFMHSYEWCTRHPCICISQGAKALLRRALNTTLSSTTTCILVSVHQTFSCSGFYKHTQKLSWAFYGASWNVKQQKKLLDAFEKVLLDSKRRCYVWRCGCGQPAIHHERQRLHGAALEARRRLIGCCPKHGRQAASSVLRRC